MALEEYSAAPPVGIDAVGAFAKSTAQLYKAICEDIVSGRLGVHERLIVADLAKRHGSSTTPVREVLSAVTRRCNFTLAHRAQVSRERRKLIAHIRAGEAGEAAALVARHVEGSGLRILEQMRAMPATREMTDAAHEQA